MKKDKPIKLCVCLPCILNSGRVAAAPAVFLFLFIILLISAAVVGETHTHTQTQPYSAGVKGRIYVESNL